MHFYECFHDAMSMALRGFPFVASKCNTFVGMKLRVDHFKGIHLVWQDFLLVHLE